MLQITFWVHGKTSILVLCKHLVCLFSLINFCIWFGGTGCNNPSLSFSSYWIGYPSGSFWLDLCCASKWTIKRVQQDCVHLRVMIILSLFFFHNFLIKDERGRDSHTNSVVDFDLYCYFSCNIFLFTSLFRFSLVSVVSYVKQKLLVISRAYFENAIWSVCNFNY